MKEYALIFRTREQNGNANPSPEQIRQMMDGWMNWMGDIAARDRLVNRGSRLGIKDSKTVGPDQIVTDGPYAELKEFINGFVIVKGTTEEVLEMAKKCPILNGGGKVEIRPLVTADNNS